MSGWVKKVKKGLALATGAFVVLVLLGVGGAYGISSLKLADRHDLTVSPPRFADEWADTVRGTRLARVLGCTGCHGKGLGGRIFADAPMFGRIVAPNLTRIRESYSDADMVRLLHHGIRPDGTGVLPAMPAQMYSNLSSRDLAAIIAFIRSRPPVADSLPSTRLALPLRAMIAVGVLDMVPDLIDHDAPLPSHVSAEDPVELGSYLAHVACTECHGSDLRGRDKFLVTPNLAIAAAYSPDDFRHFLRTGEALGGRDLGTMSSVARGRFSHFTEGEIEALHAYLSTLPIAE